MKINLQTRHIIDALIVIVVITQLTQWLQIYAHVAFSLASGIVYVICYKMARKSVNPNWRYYLWMWLPTFLVIIAPSTYSFFSSEQSILLSVFLSLPIFSLLLPLALLLWLRRRVVEQAL